MPVYRTYSEAKILLAHCYKYKKKSSINKCVQKFLQYSIPIDVFTDGTGNLPHQAFAHLFGNFVKTLILSNGAGILDTLFLIKPFQIT